MKRDFLGEQFGNYRLISRLGQGGFAEVYLGHHVRLSTQAAIKILHTYLSPQEVDGFQREAEVVANLIHPHIVRVLDFDVNHGVPFLVMDYCPNGTLRQRYRRGEHVPLTMVVSYVNQIADALQYAHDQKLIHRDIKPENMLIGRHNEILLTDFGIATIAHNTSSMSPQIAGGTIPYMAPEQIQAQARPASDQYALGIVVYEWLSGERPFGGSYSEVFAKHLMTPPPPLRPKVSDLSPEVEQVVLIALAKDPKQRFGSIQAFAIALRTANQTHQTPFQQPKAPQQPKDSPQEREILFHPSLPPSFPLIATTPVQPRTSVTANKPVDTPITPVTPATASQLQPSIAYTPATPPRLQSITAQPPASTDPKAVPKRTLSRRTTLFSLVTLGVVTAGGGVTWWELSQNPSHPPYAYRRRQDSNPDASRSPQNPSHSSYIYRGHSDAVNRVAWSPDGKRIASASDDKTVQVWDAATGGNVYTYRGHSYWVRAVAWSPDGKHLASASDDKTVQVWDASTGSPLLTYRGHSDVVRSVAWSPDGKHLASASDDDTVQVWDANNSYLLLTYRNHSNAVWSVAWSPDGKHLASASIDQTVQVWDANNGNLLLTYRSHSNLFDPVDSVAWSPDGKHLASASDDKTVQVWNATTGNLLLTYRSHSNAVRSVAWSPDGKHLASASIDKTVQVWLLL